MTALRSNRAATAAALLAVFAGLGLAAGVQTAIEPALQPFREPPETLWITSGKVLRTLSLGHNGLAADIYWTRSVQYYGARLRDHKTDFHLLSPLLNITVALDPQLMVAYYFGAFFLSAKPPRGAGEPDKAIALIRQGIAANPDEWRLWHHLGFIYYWELNDYEKAAEAYKEGSKNPKAAPFMKAMAAVILEKGGNRETSKAMWSEIYGSTEDPTIKGNALRHLQGFRAMDDIEELEKRTKLFHDQTGEWPRNFQEMVSAGLLPGIPVDPERRPYILKPDGTVELQPGSLLLSDTAPTPSSN